MQQQMIAASLAVLLVGSWSAAVAQPRMIALSPATVQQGQQVRLKSPQCTTATTVLVGGKIFPADAAGTEFTLTTESLPPGTHAVTTDCGGAVSDAASLTVLPAQPVPTVVCARNASPRDGLPSPLRPAIASEEKTRLQGAEAAAKAAQVAFPTPEEVGYRLARCSADWIWTLRLEDSLSVNVEGYADWIQIGENKQTELHLFIDGIELPNVMRYVAVDAATKVATLETVITFDRAATSATPEERESNRRALAQVLRTARAKAWDFGTGDMVVSIGPAGGPRWPTTARLRLNAYPTGLTVSAAIGLVGMLVLLVALAWLTPLLRDAGGALAPFSLAKTQMAVWFLVILGSFLFVTVTTGQAAAMSSTALILIGLSGATGLAAIAIDSRKGSIDATDRRALEAERTILTAEVDGPEGLRKQREAEPADSAKATQLDASIAKRRERIEVITKALEAKPAPEPRKTQGWLTDILSDDYGLSFHRLQMAGWTVAMVGVFIVAVWRTFAMAEFDTTMLGLLGISSGTYLGFKFPERQTQAPRE